MVKKTLSQITIALSLAVFSPVIAQTPPVIPGPVQAFVFQNDVYGVRLISRQERQRILEISTRTKDNKGRWVNTFRQYSGNCGAPSFKYLGEHQTDDFGVVRANTPQAPDTTIQANTDKGKIVRRAFEILCRV